MLDIKVRVKIQDDAAAYWGVEPRAIDEAFMKKEAMFEVLKGLKPENAIDLQRSFDGNALVFMFSDKRHMTIYNFEVEGFES